MHLMQSMGRRPMDAGAAANWRRSVLGVETATLIMSSADPRLPRPCNCRVESRSSEWIELTTRRNSTQPVWTVVTQFPIMTSSYCFCTTHWTVRIGNWVTTVVAHGHTGWILNVFSFQIFDQNPSQSSAVYFTPATPTRLSVVRAYFKNIYVAH